MQKRHVLVGDDSLCPKKLADVSEPGLGEAGRYTCELHVFVRLIGLLW